MKSRSQFERGVDWTTNRGPISNQVAAAIAMDILDHRFPAGSKLPAEKDLLTRFSVSRTVIREALKTLCAKGLIASKTKVGTVVRDMPNWNYFDSDVLKWRIKLGIDQDLLETLRDARLAVEPFVAGLAARHATQQHIADLRASVDLMEQAAEDRTIFAKADVRFHQIIADACGNFVLASFSAVTESAIMASSMLLPLEDVGLRAQAVGFHRDMLEAIIARQPGRASALMHDHIRFGREVGEPVALPNPSHPDAPAIPGFD